MGKFAILVVGSHGAGKSTTIKEHLNPLLGIGADDHGFEIDETSGFVWSQTLEESGYDVCDRICYRISLDYELFVIPTRPRWENPSKVDNIIRILTCYGYTYQELYVDKDIKNLNAAQAELAHSLLKLHASI